MLQAVNWVPGVECWRANTGAGKLEGKNGKAGRFVRFGRPGQADISGLGPSGVRIEIECKRPGGRQSPEQRTFQEIIERRGGVYFIATDAPEALEKLHAALRARFGRAV